MVKRLLEHGYSIRPQANLCYVLFFFFLFFFFFCRVYGEKTDSSYSSIDGFSTWWKLNPKVKDHENSATHQESFLKWKELEMPLKAGMTVHSLGQIEIHDVRKKWVQILDRVVDMIRFQSKQDLLFQGHVKTIKPNDTSNNSRNFIELTNYFQTRILCCWNRLFGTRN